jgi:1-acyl-sn-glycerol-3-phosphate acyltransferase
MYRTLRAYVHLGLHLYCGRIRVERMEALADGRGVLIASNHPNSFLDALVLATHLPWRMHFLARGDAFRKPWAALLLRNLYMIPVFRMSEGRAELRRTEHSLSAARELLAEGRSVLVFAEGISRNNMELQPLGKGTARIALRAWQAGLDIPILPVGLWYSGFHRLFPEVRIGSAPVITPLDLPITNEAAFLNDFNQMLRPRLATAIAPPGEQHSAHGLAKYVLAVPAVAGLLLHAPWYLAVRALAARWPKDPLFFDSVLFAWLLFTYPLWLLLLTGMGLLLGLGAWSALVWLLAPLCVVALKTMHRSRQRHGPRGSGSPGA